MFMDIAGLSMKMAHVNVMQEMNAGMMEKALDQVELMGEQLVMMIQAAEVPVDGSSFDVRV
jgi:hypothetical protein